MFVPPLGVISTPPRRSPNLFYLVHKSLKCAAAQPQPSPPCSHPGHIEHGLADWNTTGDVARSPWRDIWWRCRLWIAIYDGGDVHDTPNSFAGLPAIKVTTLWGLQRLSVAMVDGSGLVLRLKTKSPSTNPIIFSKGCSYWMQGMIHYTEVVLIVVYNTLTVLGDVWII